MSNQFSYKIVKGDDSQVILKEYKRVTSGNVEDGRWIWQNQSNPHGKMWGVLVTDNSSGKIAAGALYQPSTMFLNNKKCWHCFLVMRYKNAFITRCN